MPSVFTSCVLWVSMMRGGPPAPAVTEVSACAVALREL